jgi:D-3-phosphoglycerate dehydrogenase / 2-oxoglutarate reductase
MRFDILNAEPKEYSREAHGVLSTLGKVEETEVSQQQLKERIKDFDVLIVRLGLKVDREIIVAGNRLKFILSATTGTDHIDMEAAEQNNVRVICLKGEEEFLQSIPSTAEHTWGLILSLMRHIPDAFSHVKEGNWNRNIFKGHNLAGKNVGIIGLGRVGKQVASFATAFRCQVGAYDPYQKNWLDFVKRYERVEEILAWSDITCIHIPYDQRNHYFMGEKLLPFCKVGSVLINTSRGAVWQEKVVVDLLKKNHLAGVATDVLENELDEKLRTDSALVKLARESRCYLRVYGYDRGFYCQ